MSYLIPSSFVRREIIVQNSRFITSIEFTPELALAQNFIRQIRQEMPDASHHVYAFRIGYDKTVTEGMSDDGEPSGTSGPPTLAVLRGSQIGDITLITTRYFGGKKLGTGGLVKAYTESAQVALSHLETHLKIPRCQLFFVTEYAIYHRVKHLMQQFNLSINTETFAEKVEVLVTIVEHQKIPFIAMLTESSAGKIEVIDIE